jgi:hypothetical protein
VQNLPPKKDVATALLQRSSMYIYLDPRKEAVRVPPWFKRQPKLVLQVGLNMAVQIPDLAVDEQGISGTLSFNRSPFFCSVPWEAVFGLVGDDGRGMVWPDDVPPEAAAEAQATAAKQRPQHLRAVSATPGDQAQAAASAPASPNPGEPNPGEPAPAAGKAKPVRKKRAASPKTAKPAARAEGAEEAAAPVKPRKSRKKAPTAKATRPVAPVAQPAPAPAPTPPPEQAAAAAAPEGDPPKRRSLPPYLRVVK